MRILFLSSWLPYPPDNGSRIRAFNLLRYLARQHEICLVALSQSGAETQLGPLQEICRSVLTIPQIPFKPGTLRARLALFQPLPRSVVATYDRRIAESVRLCASSGPWDVVVVSELGIAPYAICRDLEGVPKIVDEVNISPIVERHRRPRELRLRAWDLLTKLKLIGYLRLLLNHYDVCTAASQVEQMRINAICPRARVEVIPNGVDLAHYRYEVGLEDPNTLVHIGSLTWYANYDAVRHFLSDIYPEIRLGEPRVRLRLTGASEGVDRAALSVDSSVEFTGYVHDIRPIIQRSCVSVVPLRIGGGTRLKILEAMALGTPVVTTSKGAEGLDAIHQKHLLVADAPREFASCVVSLLRDQSTRLHLAANGRQLVEEKYGWEQIGARFTHLLSDLTIARR